MRSTVTDGYFNMLQADNIQKLSAESVTRLEDHLKMFRHSMTLAW